MLADVLIIPFPYLWILTCEHIIQIGLMRESTVHREYTIVHKTQFSKLFQMIGNSPLGLFQEFRPYHITFSKENDRTHCVGNLTNGEVINDLTIGCMILLGMLVLTFTVEVGEIADRPSKQKNCIKVIQQVGSRATETRWKIGFQLVEIVGEFPLHKEAVSIICIRVEQIRHDLYDLVHIMDNGM